MTPTVRATLERSARDEYERLVEGNYNGPALRRAMDFATDMLDTIHAVAAPSDAYQAAWYRLALDEYRRLLGGLDTSPSAC